MAGKALNIKVCSPLKLHSGLSGNYHAICHYSYNSLLAFIVGKPTAQMAHLVFANKQPKAEKTIRAIFCQRSTEIETELNE